MNCTNKQKVVSFTCVFNETEKYNLSKKVSEKLEGFDAWLFSECSQNINGKLHDKAKIITEKPNVVTYYVYI